MNILIDFLIQWVNPALDFAGYAFDQLSILLTGGAAGVIFAPYDFRCLCLLCLG
jgi:hypothetical protein